MAYRATISHNIARNCFNQSVTQLQHCTKHANIVGGLSTSALSGTLLKTILSVISYHVIECMQG